MSRRSKIKTAVPADLRQALNAELVARGFSDYAALTEWLNEELEKRGLDTRVSVMATNRYGQDFEADFNAEMAEANQMLHIARQAVAQGEDAEGVVREATVRVMQTRLLKLSTGLKQAETAGDDVHKISDTTTKIVRALADLGRMDIASQKYKQQLEEAVLSGRLALLTELGEFIERQFPHYKKTFAEILKPFAAFLTGGEQSPGA
ncbi:MAG: DUF3486 family protein [Methylovulum sp.]|uniref:phage protein Gp27 family protein n=1 Tax=Methylovulum sp. TaxID=1916980 RepID=UPI00262061BB|nr:phage protein Gp27 family protein [Methylovulum sp.]MDD2725191.1 DUF3486 family protein [Methylovulum sp.]MDD5125450.1 DUF3486 family protein [Methylovulum sp.]